MGKPAAARSAGVAGSTEPDIAELSQAVEREAENNPEAQRLKTHPGSGTRNALLSLGAGHYLEIIAPDPAQANTPDDCGLRELSSPRIIQWAIHTENIAAAKSMVEAAGSRPLARNPVCGSVRMASCFAGKRWGSSRPPLSFRFSSNGRAGSPHPSSDSPRLGTAKSLRFETPQPDDLRRILHAAAVQAWRETIVTPVRRRTYHPRHSWHH